MDEYLISVIVPVFNIKNFIIRCLDSIRNQTHKNLEIIVVDDGSTDGTASILDEYSKKDCRLKIIHKKNGGVSSARILGISKSTGDYIGFVDGDDYVEPQMFEHLLNNALENGADISHCGYQMIFPDGHIDNYYGTKKIILQNHEEGIRDLLKGDFIEPGLWNKLYRRSVVLGFENSPLWDSSIKYHEDVLMNYILFSRANKSIYEDIPYYHYILRENSASTAKAKLYQVQNPQRVMQLIASDVKESKVLYPIVYERYLRTLINAIQQATWTDEATKAKKLLKQQLKDIISCKNISLKIKLIVFGISYMEPLYRVIRKIYDKFTGISKKYDLE